MFGYVTVNAEELKMREYTMYRSYYCGLCHVLKERYGRRGQFLLNYDMTFLALLQDSLYEPSVSEEKRRCIPHPVAPHQERISEATEYAADMTVLLYYQKALDDWHDEKSPRGKALAMLLHRDYKELRKRYPRQAQTLEKSVRELSRLERGKSDDIDKVAGLTGDFMAEMCDKEQDVWSEKLRDLGFYLGKFIYLVDAYDDMEKDRKKGSYNIFVSMQEKDPEHFYRNAEEIMVDMMSRCVRAYEFLPAVRNGGILKNILYSGVWIKYAAACKRMTGKASAAGVDEQTEDM